MNPLRSVWEDLKNRKLLPVAGILLVAIAAVPVVLSSSSGSAPTPITSPSSGPVTAGLPAVNDTSSPASNAPHGKARDPFAPSSEATSSGGSSTATTGTTSPVSGTTGQTGSTGSSGSSGSSGSTGSTGSSSSGGGSTSPGSSPGGPPIHTPKPKKTVPTLTRTQSYSVALAITNSSGGIDTITPLERLTPLPSASEPLVVELGVEKGGSRVLFAVQPGTRVSGPGQCIPGPIDCEILSLTQSQTEALSVGSAEVALFAVTGISAVKHASRAAAMGARNQSSGAGRRLLDHSPLDALSLFRYEPSLGAVVDLRNLTLRNN